jgi:RimJ/RimL family protein N-acetyltransferase
LVSTRSLRDLLNQRRALVSTRSLRDLLNQRWPGADLASLVAMATRDDVLREMRADDVAAVLAIQEPAAIAGLAEVFPQDAHPFPRAVLTERWHEEIRDPGIECFVIQSAGAVAGFAAVSGEEILHFGTALDEWGTGLATAAQDALVAHIGRTAAGHPRLRVYAGNARGRRFWEKHGWTATGERSRGGLPPYAELLTYELRRQIDRNPS